MDCLELCLAQGSSWNHQPSCLVQFLRIRIESSFDFVTTEYICNTLRTLGLGLEYLRFCLWLLTYKTIYNTAKNKKFMRPLQFALHCLFTHITFIFNLIRLRNIILKKESTVKLGNKERFDKEEIGIKEPFPVTNLPFTS